MIGELKSKTWLFPDIEFNDHHWIMCVRLYKNNILINPVKHELGPEYHAEYNAITWYKSAKPQDKAATIIKRGKQGRNVYEQALFEAHAKWLKRKETHNVVKCVPMIVKVWDLEMTPEKFAKIDDKWIGQRKYNGVRCLACKINNKVHLVSRHLKPYRMPEIEAALATMPANIMLDGELYKFGLSLQEISGIVRGAENARKNELWYQIFDCYEFDNKDAPFVERYARISHMRDKYIKISPNVTIGKFTNYREFEREMTKVYKEFLKEGYEGIILRAANAPYEPGIHGRRSDFIYKHKPKLTMEFKIVGYTDGRGKEKGAVIWICETRHGDKFNVRPKWPYKEREEIFKKLENSTAFNKYKNKLMTVEYADLSIAGIPLQPRAIAIRDYE